MSFEIKLLEQAAARMVEDVLPGVVQIRSGRTRSRRGRGAGTGFLWSPHGSVITNYHVIAGSRRIEVVLADDRSFFAEVEESSRGLDLAMLRLRGAPDDLPLPRLGDSDSLRIGELAFAVGNPWGRRGAVTAGIVSGLGAGGGSFGRARYVHTDVYLAPGNSGGPLVNARGEVIGVNSTILGGLSLAIPINTAGAWASGGLRTTPRPRLGVRVQGLMLPASLLEAAGQKAGLLVSGVESRSLAERVGLLVGDVLLDAAGAALEDAASLGDALARSTEATVRLRLMRGGELREVEVDLGSSQARSA